MKSPISVRKTNMCKFKGLKIRALDLGSFVRELVTFVKVTNWRCNRVWAVLVLSLFASSQIDAGTTF